MTARTVPCPRCGATLTPTFRSSYRGLEVNVSGITAGCELCLDVVRALAARMEQNLQEFERELSKRLAAQVFGPAVDPVTGEAAR